MSYTDNEVYSITKEASQSLVTKVGFVMNSPMTKGYYRGPMV